MRDFGNCIFVEKRVDQFCLDFNPLEAILRSGECFCSAVCYSESHARVRPCGVERNISSACPHAPECRNNPLERPFHAENNRISFGNSYAFESRRESIRLKLKFSITKCSRSIC